MPAPHSFRSRMLALVLCGMLAWLPAARAADPVPPITPVPAVNLANGPMYGLRANTHPNFLLLLSVTFPISEPAYHGDGGSYVAATEYLGYFNHLKCYIYSGGERNVTDGFFIISGDANASTHACDGKSFSGNFMNWATMSSLDILRYALTGGDRIVDEDQRTILQRAFLQKDNYAQGDYFPRKILSAGINSVTPFKVSPLYIVSCENKVLFSDVKDVSGATCKSGSRNGSWGGTEKSQGEYLVRVQVCDAVEASGRSDLCRAYGSNAKPVGVLQRNAGRMRLGVMSYLLDSTASRYGGILRAPMKYLGPMQYAAPDYKESANTNSEWNGATGVLTANPQPDATVTNISGAINYINRFGRDGLYKRYDPLSELYYEGIRYLQGLQPTADATSGMQAAMRDGFPVITKWDDPLPVGCQRNFIVTVADVNTNYDHAVPGHAYTVSNGDGPRAAEPAIDKRTPLLNVTPWTRKVGEMEVDASGAYGNPNPNSAILKTTKSLDLTRTGADDYGSYYIAGLAYWANTNNIRVDDKATRVTTFSVDVDDQGDGTMNGGTRTIKPRNSQLYLAAKYGGFTDSNDDANPFKALDGTGNTVSSNTEWARSGTDIPRNYFLVSQTQVMIDAFKQIFDQTSPAIGAVAGAGGSSSAARVTSSGAWMYRGWFSMDRWAGGLQKVGLSLSSDGSNVIVASRPEWDAGDLLTGNATTPAPAPGGRLIYTQTMGADKNLSTVPFTWDQLSADQRTALNVAPDGTADTLGKDRLNYIRGDRSKEEDKAGGMFRFRGRVLGDIINSNVVYAGAPTGRGAGAAYQAFAESYKNRSAAVYVGANDGMLHAFSADDGRELFAYVPSVLIPALPAYTAKAYPHRAYVDGGISVDDVLVGGQWRTVLAAGLGGGAQGVFALDVTNPGNFIQGSGALLEFSDRDDPHMGNVFGAPVVARFRTDDGKGAPVYENFLVVQSGYNNYVDDGTKTFDADARGALFLLRLNKPAGEAWQRGLNYFKILLPAGDRSVPNAYGPPALVRNAAGIVTRGYIGDLQGRLWRLDFTGGKPWSNALGKDASPKPLFTATDTAASPNSQPITMRPSVVFAPGGGYVVLFGTGKHVDIADAASSSFRQQSLYAVFDDLQTLNLQRTNLEARTADASAGASAKISGNAFTYGARSTDKRGWVLDFPDSVKNGEKGVSNLVVQDGQVYFNTAIPGIDVCQSGSGRTYALDALTGMTGAGAATAIRSSSGMLGAPLVMAVGQSAVGERNAVGMRAVSKRNVVVSSGANGVGISSGLSTAAAMTVPAGRFSWREVLNWQAITDVLRNPAKKP